jgi:hypothetical protein
MRAHRTSRQRREGEQQQAAHDPEPVMPFATPRRTIKALEPTRPSAVRIGSKTKAGKRR